MLAAVCSTESNLQAPSNTFLCVLSIYSPVHCPQCAMQRCVQVAEKEAQRGSNPLRVKKLFVLAALIIEQYHQHMRSSQKEKTKKRRPEVTFCLAACCFAI